MKRVDSLESGTEMAQFQGAFRPLFACESVLLGLKAIDVTLALCCGGALEEYNFIRGQYVQLSCSGPGD